MVGTRGGVMTGPKYDAVSVRSAVGLANVCRALAELRQLLRDEGDDQTSVLSQLLAAVRARESDQVVADLLDELNEAVQDAGDMAGIFGFDTSRGESAGLETLEIVYRCPLRRCTGRVDVGHQPLCMFSSA